MRIPSRRIRIAIAILALGAGGAILAAAGIKHAHGALDEECVRFALAHAGRGTPFDEDAIRFLSERATERRAHGHPDDPMGRAKLARLYLSRFKSTGSAEDLRAGVAGLERLAREAPQDAGAHAALVGAYLSFHRFREALEQAYAARALAIGPEEVDAARLVLFDALASVGRYAEASAQLDSLGAAARTASGLSRKARQLAMRDSLPAARAVLDSAYAQALAGSATPPVRAWYRVERAGLSERMGDIRSAVTDLTSALVDFPGYPAALESLARIAYAWDGNLQAASRLFEAAWANGGHLTLLLDRERVLREMGGTGVADSLRLAFQAQGRSDTIQLRWNRLPLAYQLSEDPARRDLALQLAEDDVAERATPEAWTCLAWVYYKRGSLPVAYHFARLAAEAPGRDPARLTRLALIYWHAGKRDGAKALLADAVARKGKRFAWKSRKGREGLDGSGELLATGGSQVGDLLEFHSHDP
ncbi:MAG: tetratricopeptide repeat protein [Fibrobacteres bacterium]|nr:tetratricopeptide repeat protein [Fibrobacterota bacterium]